MVAGGREIRLGGWLIRDRARGGGGGIGCKEGDNQHQRVENGGQ